MRKHVRSLVAESETTLVLLFRCQGHRTLQASKWSNTVSMRWPPYVSVLAAAEYRPMQACKTCFVMAGLKALHCIASNPS